ncbi:hypothetical protein [Ureibacillus sp. GCM10028918]|uniref:hypothetical protein n=1 Tax=Ureibacillus sp. GCM10028918 TaxID=3273429 RepID=UPI003621514F
MIDFVFSGAMSAIKTYNGVQDKKEIVNKLIKLEAEQTRLFDMFANEIKAIQDGPFYVGLTYLEEAREDHRDAKDSKRMLKDALQEFIKAYGIQRAKIRKTAFDIHFMGFVQSYISITWLMLDSPKDAQNWIEKSIVALQEGQRLFKNDLANLNQEISAIQIESNRYDRKVNDSMIHAGLDFFFGNESLEMKKRKIPEYRNLVSRYSRAQTESNKYMLEMQDLQKQIKIETLKYEESKSEITSRITGIIGTITDSPKSFSEKLSKDAILSNLNSDSPKGLINRFKNKS